MTGEPVRTLRVGAALLLAALVPLLGARLFVDGAAACSPATAHACCCAPAEEGCPPRGGCCEVRPGQPLPPSLPADAVAPAPPACEASAVSVPAPGAGRSSPAPPDVPQRARSAPLFVLHASLLI